MTKDYKGHRSAPKSKSNMMCIFPCTYSGTTYNQCIDSGNTNCIRTSTMCNWPAFIAGQIFPFRSKFCWTCCTGYNGYDEGAWCCTQVDSGGNYVGGHWGFCKMEWEGGHCDYHNDVTGISSHKNYSSRCMSLNDAVHTWAFGLKVSLVSSDAQAR